MSKSIYVDVDLDIKGVNSRVLANGVALLFAYIVKSSLNKSATLLFQLILHT